MPIFKKIIKKTSPYTSPENHNFTSYWISICITVLEGAQNTRILNLHWL